MPATFWFLALAAGCLWWPRDLGGIGARRLWTLPALAAIGLAVVEGFVNGVGLAIVLVLAAAAAYAHRGSHSILRSLAHAYVFAVTTGLFLHVLPGFANPVVIDHVVLSPGAVPYTQYLNVDKGLAGLLLLGLYVPERVAHDRGPRPLAPFLARFLLVVSAAIVVALATGYLRWDPKLPSWWPMWLGIMLVLTALPEEAAFRGVVHSWLAERRGDPRSVLAIVVGGLLFGVAHLAGGPVYVIVSAVAGIGYGWIYASTGSIAAAILAHTGLNTIHLLLFTYPSLAIVP
jgi:membrane protease YdiL (CAAX protease family)